MLSEQIEVTTEPTSIQQLIATARGGVALADIPEKCTGIMLRYSVAETKVVTLSEAGSTNGAIVLDKDTEDLVAVTLDQFNISQPLLSCDSGTVTVHVIVNQRLI